MPADPRDSADRATAEADAMIERLRQECGYDPHDPEIIYPDAYVERLERELRERLRVNVGLVWENAELRRGRDAR